MVGSVVRGVGWTEPSRRVGKIVTLTWGRFEGAPFRWDLLVGDCLDGERLLGERLVGEWVAISLPSLRLKLGCART